MQEVDDKAQCLSLMSKAPVAYLTTLGTDGSPHTRAIFNLRNRDQYPDHAYLYEGHDEDLLVYMGTNTSSNKRADIQNDPRVSLYYCLPDQSLGICLVGNAEIVEDIALKRKLWADGWERYYTETGNADDPDFTVIRLLPSEASGWMAGRKVRFDVGG